jgi:ribosomal protein L30/L7E
MCSTDRKKDIIAIAQGLRLCVASDRKKDIIAIAQSLRVCVVSDRKNKSLLLPKVSDYV